jgi:uncharacterized protein (TIGR03067 family)
MNILALLALSLPLGAPALKDPPTKMPSIVGEWVRIGHTQTGQPVAVGRENHHQVFTAEGEWVYWYGDGRAQPGGKTYAIDIKQSPPTIDIFLNPAKDDGWRGIYKIEKDTLTLCLIKIPGQRPKTFESSADKPTNVWVFQRVAKD